jgi:hypothetical protein
VEIQAQALLFQSPWSVPQAMATRSGNSAPARDKTLEAGAESVIGPTAETGILFPDTRCFFQEFSAKAGVSSFRPRIGGTIGLHQTFGFFHPGRAIGGFVVVFGNSARAGRPKVRDGALHSPLFGCGCPGVKVR